MYDAQCLSNAKWRPKKLSLIERSVTSTCFQRHHLQTVTVLSAVSAVTVILMLPSKRIVFPFNSSLCLDKKLLNIL